MLPSNFEISYGVGNDNKIIYISYLINHTTCIFRSNTINHCK